MSDEKIEKPWAVFGVGFGNFGKIIEDSKNSCYIQYCEGQRYSPDLWDSKWVKTFDTSVKALAYFKIKNKNYSKKEVINLFLRDFPSERKNLEKFLAQSQP